jgi:hypothetical protein
LGFDRNRQKTFIFDKAKMIFLTQFVLLFLITFLGFAVVNIFLPKASLAEKISAGFLLGIAIFTYVIFLAGWLFNIPFRTAPVLVILFWLITVALYLNWVFFKWTSLKFNVVDKLKCLRISIISLPLFEKFLFVLLVFIFVSVLANNFFWPVWSWDALALYDLRARQLFLAGKIIGSFTVTGGSYPLLTSMSHALVYLFGGTNPQFIYSLFYLSLSLIVYSFLRRFLKRSHSLLALLFLVVTPVLVIQSESTLTDLPQSAYLVPGFLFAILGMNEDNKSYIVLSGLFFSLSLWVRNEPFWIVGFFVLIPYLFNKGWFNLGVWFYSTIFVVYCPWTYFVTAFAVKQAYVPQPTENIIQITDTRFWPTLIGFVLKNIIMPVWPVFLALIFLLIVKRKTLPKVVKLVSFSTLSVLVFLTAGTGVYMTFFNGWPALWSSLQRIVIFLYTLLIADVALLLFPQKSDL